VPPLRVPLEGPPGAPGVPIGVVFPVVGIGCTPEVLSDEEPSSEEQAAISAARDTTRAKRKPITNNVDR
jgi:hypothetical protein